MPEEDLSLKMQSLTVISLFFHHTGSQIYYTVFKENIKNKTMVKRKMKKSKVNAQDKGKV